MTHPVFDAWTALVILVNAATIGAETWGPLACGHAPEAVWSHGLCVAAWPLGLQIYKLILYI